MKRMDETERVIRDLQAKPGAAVYSRILADATAAPFQATKETSQRAMRPRSIDMIRKHIKGFVAASAAAAIVLAGMFVWMTAGTKPAMSAHAALEEAIRNSETADWVHMSVVVDGKVGEVWFSFHPLKKITKGGPKDQIRYQDSLSGKSFTYDGSSHTITVRDFKPPDPAPQDMFDFLVKNYDKAQKRGAKILWSSENSGTKDLDVATLNEGLETVIAYIDHDSCRIVRLIRKGRGGDGREYNWDYALDYPSKGPGDIYAAGAPRDAKVVTIDSSAAAGQSKSS
jgi:hypothetical protein